MLFRGLRGTLAKRSGNVVPCVLLLQATPRSFASPSGWIVINVSLNVSLAFGTCLRELLQRANPSARIAEHRKKANAFCFQTSSRDAK